MPGNEAQLRHHTSRWSSLRHVEWSLKARSREKRRSTKCIKKEITGIMAERFANMQGKGQLAGIEM